MERNTKFIRGDKNIMVHMQTVYGNKMEPKYCVPHHIVNNTITDGHGVNKPPSLQLHYFLQTNAFRTTDLAFI